MRDSSCDVEYDIDPFCRDIDELLTRECRAITLGNPQSDTSSAVRKEE
jgi:hypothetical protein